MERSNPLIGRLLFGSASGLRLAYSQFGLRMMRALFIAVGFCLAGCLHVEKTSSAPISGVLLYKTGAPIAGAQIWAKFTMPGGRVFTRREVVFGPAITAPDGTFTINVTSLTMLQSGSENFDGDPSPELIILHRDIGGFMTWFADKRKEGDFGRIVWDYPMWQSRTVGFRIISELPRHEREIAQKYLEQGK